jgi:transcriptional regulator with XRE-family HTH domain
LKCPCCAGQGRLFSAGELPGLFIQRVRLAKGLSLKRLSRLTGIHYTSISQIENGKENAGPERLRRIAEALEIPEDELASGELPGRRLWRMRVMARHSQSEAAQALNLARETVSALENGRKAVTNYYSAIYARTYGSHSAQHS